jgi:PKD repeat protein
MHNRLLQAALAMISTSLLLTMGGAAYAVGADQSTLVNMAPSTATPNINDGNVYAIVQVGTRIIVGGDFTNANPPGDNNSAHTVTRRSILAFSAATGAIDTGFTPSLNGQVRALFPGPSPDTVYVGGSFSTVNGTTSRDLTLVSTVTGQIVPGFAPSSINGMVWAISQTGSRLLVAGQFTTVGGVAHGGIAAVNATTGAVDNAYLAVQFTGHHNYNGTSGANGAVGPHEMDLSPDGTRLVVVGNFKNANGVLHDQIVVIDVGASAATLDTGWNTAAYSAACSSGSFDTYMRGVSFAPDGSYFVVVATGGGGTSYNTDGTRSLCDTAARWNTATTGTNVRPAWIDYSGNDSFESVTTAGAAIYVGGHFRWLNNPNCSDCAGSGSVPRPGIAALDPLNGMPLSWNPGRNPRGAGAYWLYATANGLYAGGDTDFIGVGDTYTERDRVSYFPLAGGEAVPVYQPATLPATVYLAGKVSGASPDVLQARPFTGTSAGATTTLTSTAVAWSQVRGAFTAGSRLFYGYTDGKLHTASFDGANVGTPSLVDPYDDPIWSTVDTGSGQTYRGVAPSMYGTEMTNVRGMVFTNGRLYYALAGQSALRWRYFEPDDGVIGATESTVSGATLGLGNIAGMFLSGGTLYWADNATGNLHSVPWNNGAPSSASDTVVSGPGIDGNDWRTRGMFALTAAVLPPTASFTSSCTDLSCSFDGSASTAPGATITAYDWDFGDGTQGGGATPTHAYGGAGTYAVTLTVTTSQGAQAAETQSVSPSLPGGTPIAFVAQASTNGNATTESVTVPATVATGDAMLLLVTGVTAATPTAPSGWTLVGRSPTSTTSLTTALYSRVATASDAGGSVAVGFGSVTHGTVQLVDYRGTNASAPIQQAVGLVTGTATSVTSPTVAIAGSGCWVVTYWAAKSSVVTTWTTPAGQVNRGAANGSGNGRINSVVVDSGAPVTGNAGGLTATTDQPAGTTTAWTIVLTQ